MPRPLTPQENIARAEAALAEAKSNPEPCCGHERGVWVRHTRALLRKSNTYAIKVIRKRSTPQELKQRAQEILDEIDSLYPLPLDN